MQAVSLMPVWSLAQDTITTNHLQIQAYAELYYSYDFSKPANHERPTFLYNYKRHNEVNLNLGVVKISYVNDKVRANLGLMAGTYAQYNLSAEQGLLQNVYEANAGFKVSQKQNLWFDAGVFSSHIGFESAIGKDCWTLSRSLAAENSPYYEAGAKLSYTNKSENIYAAVMYLNGWQRIQRVSDNQTPAFGTQLTLKPNDKLQVNWSSFVGSDVPDSLLKWRVFNNFFTVWQLHQKLSITAGLDIGIQQQKKDSAAFYNWYTPQIILKYKINSIIGLAARAEYYSDKNEVIITTGTANGFQTLGYSMNIDYCPTKNLMLRLEGRMLQSKDAIFTLNNRQSFQNYCLTSSLAFSF